MSNVQFTTALTEVRPFATKAEAEAGTDQTRAMNPLRVKEAIDRFAPTLTAGQIKTLLETLQLHNRLNKSGVHGGDFALNYQGEEDMLQYSYLNSHYPAISRGDFWIHNAAPFGNIVEGHWIVALIDAPTFEDEYESSLGEWLILPFGNMLTVAEVVTAVNALTGTNRLVKKAVRGADFALNRRNAGDIFDPTFRVDSMNNILKGDFWIYQESSGGTTDLLLEGDWVVAMADDVVPSSVNYENPAMWWIIHFTGTPITPIISLSHYRLSPTSEAQTLTIPNIQAYIFSLTINKLTYYGKVDDGSFGDYDFVYSFSGANTIITINPDVLATFETGMVVDVVYTLE